MGQILTDKLHRIAYATDASVYREMPLGVAYPETVEDIQALVAEASRRGTHLIPRAGGTSIAGQVVGSGIVCDISKHWNKILEINPSQRWARVHPGVVRDELNLALKPHGLFFSPETSTSNRCCIGGMLGNNSCGTHSLVYGSTRHHILEAVGVLSDGSVEHFRDYTVAELEERFGPRFWEKDPESLIENIYAQIIRWGLDEETVRLVMDSFPDTSLRRRSCGYAIDETIASLCDCIKGDNKEGIAASGVGDVVLPLKERKVNLCPLLCGSEGTLAFITEIKVSLDPLPPAERMVVCAHCNSLEDSLYANLAALRHGPVAVELMDGQILDLSEGNLEQQRNRFFIEGKPAALIIAEFEGPEMEAKASAFEAEVLGKAASGYDNIDGSDIADVNNRASLAYCCTRVYGKDISRVWDLRKAGLGVLSGMKGDAKPVGVIEDTAVAPERMPAYIADFKEMLQRLGLSCVYYGHISTGELHLRPILNLKDPADRKKFREVARETALLVRKHRGSLSGEHGDGRLRGEFIPLMYGDAVYQMMRQVKAVWDSSGVFNIGKITDTPPMDEYLRYLLNSGTGRESGYILPEKTYFRWNAGFTHGESNPYAFLCSIEQCNGAGACRKSNAMGGTMCPAFKVSGDELCVTRARANVIRELLTYGFSGVGNSGDGGKKKGGSFSEIVKGPEIEEVLFSCLACKGCRSECPSNVDMTRLRAELLQHKWDAQGTPLGVWMVARMAAFERLGHLVRPLYNFFAGWKVSERLIKRLVHFAAERHIPKLSHHSMRYLVGLENKKMHSVKSQHKGKVYLFADEFTDRQEAELGLTFARLLLKLGYDVEIPYHVESGRAAISKGCLRLAKKFAKRNVELLGDIVSAETPLVGIEPSCILSFRDEYPDLVPEELSEKAKSLGRNALLYDEFLVREMERGNIKADMFSDEAAEIYLHGHCHQKALVGIEKTEKALRGLLCGATVHTIPSGCCGMAGSFGYEKTHYRTSMEIGEMILFPAVRKAISSDEKPVLVAAPGTSCRQQILDGTGVKAFHPIEILWNYSIFDRV
ncbi:MAG: FAD-binding protein [Bacteroidales bacterium]|nr:FAD-binding protein [Bacteroidales bacterium]